MHRYYIDDNGNKEGPYDLVTVMRRIRSGKILPESLLYIDDAELPVAAQSIDDIALFFNHQEEPAYPDLAPVRKLSLEKLLHDGWHFTLEHNVMTVYSGSILLLALLVASMLVDILGVERGGVLSWCIFMLLHNVYLLFALRLHRGQTLGEHFINKQLAPVLFTLTLMSALLAMMIFGGLILLIIPGLAIAVLYAFAPFLLLDHRYRLVEAFHASRLLVQKHRWRYLGALSALVGLHVLCLALVLPVPLSLPIFAAALSSLYEEISAS